MRALAAVVLAGVAISVSAAATPSPSPVAGYSFDEGRGAVVDDASGGGHDGSLRKTVWAAGRHGRALAFDGRASWVTVPTSPAFDLGSALTVEAWVYPTALGR